MEDIFQELQAKHPEMPQATLNLFEKARLKAFANERGIRMISVTGGKLVVEPIALTRAQASALRRKAGRYHADKEKMSVPLRVFVPRTAEESADDAGMLTQVFAYLKGFFDEQKSDSK